MIKPTGPGKYDFTQNGPNDWTILLFNYDISGWSLKKEHRDFLDPNIIPLLKGGSGVKIVGQASTTGADLFDFQLSRGRAQDLLTYFRLQAGSSFPATPPDGFGKTRALAITGINNKEDERWRAVWLRVWDKAHPPPNLGEGPFVPNVKPSNGFGPGEFFDLLGMLVAAADTGIDIAGMYAASAALESLGMAVSVGSLALSAFSAMIAMPAMWRSGDLLAEFNGKVQGYADALQDMAEQYSDDSLDKMPVKKWPAIKQPFPHTQGALPTSASDAVWRHAQQVGCDMAFKDAMKMDLEPVEISAQINNRPVKIKANGKMVLRGLWVTTKGNAGLKIINQVNEELKKQGKPNWPTH